jgi:hypothetical protein
MATPSNLMFNYPVDHDNTEPIIVSSTAKETPFYGKLSDNTKTKLVKEALASYGKITDCNLRAVYRKDCGKAYVSDRIIPTIVDVEVINNKVVKVYFSDGTTEKAVLSKNDAYSFEYGISICIIKRILSEKTNGNGTAIYNKLIDYAIKVYNDNRAEEKAVAECVKAAKIADQKKAEKEKARRIEIAEKRKEREIEIQTEAYLRAMRKFNDEQVEKFGMDFACEFKSTDDVPELNSEQKSDN